MNMFGEGKQNANTRPQQLYLGSLRCMVGGTFFKVGGHKWKSKKIEKIFVV